MLLVDVNSLVYAHQKDAPEHEKHRTRLEAIEPGPRHWDVFTGLCRSGRAKGSLAPDAYLAAVAIESGCEWVTTDRGFGRYPGLCWRHPLE